jgi:hypothetical protein
MLSFSQPLSFMGTKKIKGKHLTSVNALSRANYSLSQNPLSKLSLNDRRQNRPREHYRYQELWYGR